MTYMSWINFEPQNFRNLFQPEIFGISDISIVIPVKDNQAGIDRIFKQVSSWSKHLFPAEIIVVDNLSEKPIQIPETEFSSAVISCTKKGPAAARNMGARHAKGSWILFIDSDCILNQRLLDAYVRGQDGAIAYSGTVVSDSGDLLSRYYDAQEILRPFHNVDHRPQYLVTANSLVYRRAFERIGGFSEEFKLAAGEDVDLGFRLSTIGYLQYVEDAYVEHHFEPSLVDFMSRFFRYGRGNFQLAKKHQVDLFPRRFRPNHKVFSHHLLSLVQWWSLLMGYLYQQYFVHRAARTA